MHYESQGSMIKYWINSIVLVGAEVAYILETNALRVRILYVHHISIRVSPFMLQFRLQMKVSLITVIIVH